MITGVPPKADVSRPRSAGSHEHGAALHVTYPLQDKEHSEKASSHQGLTTDKLLDAATHDGAIAGDRWCAQSARWGSGVYQSVSPAIRQREVAVN